MDKTTNEFGRDGRMAEVSGTWQTNTLAGLPSGAQSLHEGEAMTERLTDWETTRLSKHFILLDFLADHEVYRPRGGPRPLAFDETWNNEHDALARGLCSHLLEPLMMDERVGPISIADAFWPSDFKSGHRGKEHRWTQGEAVVDIALYRMVDEGMRHSDLRKTVMSIEAIDGCRDRVLSYLETEFVCVTFKPDGARKTGVA